MKIMKSIIRSKASRDDRRPWIDIEVSEDGLLEIQEANYQGRRLACAGTRLNLATEFARINANGLPIVVYVTMEENVRAAPLMEVPPGQSTIAFIGQYDPATDIFNCLDFEDEDTGEHTFETAVNAPDDEDARIDEAANELLRVLAEQSREQAEFQQKVRTRAQEMLAQAVASKEEQPQ